jgi:hypothetical protein
MNEPKAMREIHEIREQLSREKKGLTIEERVARTNIAIDRVQKEFGIKVIDALPERRYSVTVTSI